MRVISIFSIAFLTLSIWSLFFAVSHLKSESQVELEITQEVDEDTKESEQEELEQHDAEKVEDEDDHDLVESSEVETAEQSTEKVESSRVEEKPTTLIAQASSRYNDILYDFEKDHPISVDDLLQALALNE
ncbi:hypothetical protein [Amphibacillus indicireducens]|uniref:Uncharacterized protein n=1 Tax=Amphibacillus indicireducens TaxID=1076330 RepID=A0ABP7VRI8_9BACI